MHSKQAENRNETTSPATQNIPTRVRGGSALFCILSCCAIAITAPMSPVQASWTEGGLTIHTLDEIRPYVEASVAANIADGGLDPRTPVLLPPESDINDPKIWPAILLQSGLTLRDQNGVTEWSVNDPATSASRMSARRIEGTPTPPALNDSEALHSGAVYLGGQRMEGPFRIDLDGHSVLLNGVAVFPPPGPQTEPVIATSGQEQEFELITRLMDSFESDRRTLGTASAQEKLETSFERDPGVLRITWVSEDVARLQWKDGRDEILSFEELRSADEPDVAFQQEHLSAQADLLRQALRDNATLLCGATYLIPIFHLSAVNFVQTIDRVRTSAEPTALKLLRIQAHIGHREAAADLIANAR